MSEPSAGLDRLFNPKSVAVIGASKSFAKTGTAILFSILAGGYRGEIYPINPKETEILGLRAYSSLNTTPTTPDVAIICVQAELVPQVIKECGEAGIGFGSMEELDKVLPPFWSHGNPVDVTGAGLGGDFDMLTKPIEILLRDRNIDAVIWMVPALGSLFERVAPRMDPHILKCFSKTALGSMATQEMEMAKGIIELKEKYNKPLVAILIGLYGRNGTEHIRFLEENGVPVYETTHQAAFVLSKLVEYREYREGRGNTSLARNSK